MIALSFHPKRMSLPYASVSVTALYIYVYTLYCSISVPLFQSGGISTGMKLPAPCQSSHAMY